MKTLFQILACFALVPWIGIAMFSPMALASLDSFNDRSLLATLTVWFGYPIAIGLLFYLLDWSLLGMSPRFVLLFCSLPPLALLLLLGIPQAFVNHLRGLKPYGYTLTDRYVYMHAERIEGADPATFQEIIPSLYDYARDATHVFFRTRTIDGADPASIGPLSEQDHRGYWKDRSSVYRNGRRVEQAESASFEKLSEFYARDRERVYFDGTPFRDVDRATFEVLKDGIYARDRSGLYLLDHRVFEGADPDSFEVIEDSEYARDAHRVYLQPRGRDDAGRVIEGADRATFMPLGRGYAKDAARVYYRSDSGVEVVEGADAASFEITNYDSATNTEAKDHQRRYMQGKPR